MTEIIEYKIKVHDCRPDKRRTGLVVNRDIEWNDTLDDGIANSTDISNRAVIIELSKNDVPRAMIEFWPMERDDVRLATLHRLYLSKDHHDILMEFQWAQFAMLAMEVGVLIFPINHPVDYSKLIGVEPTLYTDMVVGVSPIQMTPTH